MMTDFGREMEGRGELTCGCENAGFIPPRFLIAKGHLFRESCSAGSSRESFHHILIMPFLT